MNQSQKYSLKSILACALGLTVISSAGIAQITLDGLVAEESFAGYSNGFINGQDTDSTTGFAGTETWGGTASVAARGFNAASTGGLSYPLLPNSGGKAVAYRTTTFNDTNTTGVTLATAAPISNITNTELFFSFLINADDYTLRAGDTAAHGVTVSFNHGSAAGQNIGVFFGGASGQLGINHRVTGGNSIQMTGLSLQPGTNLVVLGVNAHSANPQATYSLWLNPDLSALGTIGSGDYNFDTSFGVVTGNNSFGFYGWALQQRFNGIQTVDIDELRLGASFDDVAPIPEPSTYALIFGTLFLAFAAVRRRAQKA